MVYHFGEYSLDSARRELRCGTSLVAVEPQVFDVLQFLLCNRQRVVSKDDLFAAVWGGRNVSDSTLSSRITAVRHAIGDTGDEQRFIKTLSRIGPIGTIVALLAPTAHGVPECLVQQFRRYGFRQMRVESRLFRSAYVIGLTVSGEGDEHESGAELRS